MRAAASLLNRMVERGQRCSLVLHGQTLRRIRIQAGGGEWGTALAALAAVRADAERPLSRWCAMLWAPTGAAEAVDAARLYVVTASLTPALASGCWRCARPAATSPWCGSTHPASPASSGCRAATDAASLQLARAGVAVARLRADDDVKAVLSAAIATECRACLSAWRCAARR